jgi:hypothetical protein
MRTDQSDNLTSLVHRAVQARRDAEAGHVVDSLIRDYIGPDQKVMSVSNFRSALVQALKAARIKGEDDAGDILTLT